MSHYEFILTKDLWLSLYTYSWEYHHKFKYFVVHGLETKCIASHSKYENKRLKFRDIILEQIAIFTYKILEMSYNY